MKTYKTKLIESSELEQVTCDWCGVVIPECGPNEMRDFDLRFSTGHSYSYDFDGTGWYVDDLCDDCAEKLRKLLENAGITVSELDY